MAQANFTVDNTLSVSEKQEAYIRYSYVCIYKNPPKYYIFFTRPGKDAYSRLSSDQKAKLELLYTEGFFVLKVIKMTLKDFILSVTEAKAFNPTHLAIEAHRDVSRYQNYLDYRKQSKYAKQPHHKPKELCEKVVAKNDWREKKGFNKKRIEKSPFGASKHIAKKASNKSYRRWTVQRLKDEDYDAFYQTKDIHFFNERDWD